MCDWRQGGGRPWTLETRKELSPPGPQHLGPLQQTPVHLKCQVKEKKKKKQNASKSAHLRAEVRSLVSRPLDILPHSLKAEGQPVAAPYLQAVLEVGKKWEGQQDLPGHRGAKMLCKSEYFIRKIIEIL